MRKRIAFSLIAVLALGLALAETRAFADEAPAKSLYSRLGGVPAIAAVVDDFVNRLLQAPKITANVKVVQGVKRVGVPGIKYLLTEQFCAASEGPQRYSGRSMKEAHKDLGITEEEWQATAADLQASLDKFKVPSREQMEVLAVVSSTKKDVVAPAQ